jgi:hypothetical protein
MTLDEIKADSDLEKKLKSIHKDITSVLKDDVGHDKFSYRESEISPMLSHEAVNQHIASNRLKKINTLSKLSENWESFNTYYKDDNIMKKIGVEFLEGKLHFDDKIIQTIKDYPHKKEVLYYFNKGTDVSMANVTGDDYNKFKAQILPSIEKEATIHLEQKQSLLKNLKIISENKSQSQLEYFVKLSEGTTPAGKMDLEWSSILGTVKQQIQEGNFIAQQKDNKIVIELPISGTKKENGLDVKSPSTLMSLDLDNPKDFSFEVGSLSKPKMAFEDRLKSIRDKAFGNNDNAKTFKPT